VGGAVEVALAELAGSDPSGTLALVSEIAQATAQLQGLMIHAQVHLARLRPPPVGDAEDPASGPYSEFAADELAAELGQSPRAQSDRLATAWDRPARARSDRQLCLSRSVPTARATAAAMARSPSQSRFGFGRR